MVPKTQQEPKILILMEIGMCWIIAITIGTVPLYYYNEESQTCYLQDILRWEYLIFRFIIVVVIPLIIIGFVYFKIYKLIRVQVRMMKIFLLLICCFITVKIVDSNEFSQLSH